MGNGESAYDGSHDDDDEWARPPSYAGSSTDAPHRHMQQTTFIPDNFDSLDQVFTVTLTC